MCLLPTWPLLSVHTSTTTPSMQVSYRLALFTKSTTINMGRETASQVRHTLQLNLQRVLMLTIIVVALHGGPGAMSSPSHAQVFDPAAYRVVLFDQRGCGKSQPLGELEENTSLHLVADIEALRIHMGISKWEMVFGGSWGSTLALLYAQTHPNAVGSLLLRGVFLNSKEEFAFTMGPVSMLFPELYEEVLSHLGPGERADPILGFHRILSSGSAEVAIPAARAYNKLPVAISAVVVPPEILNAVMGTDEEALKSARLHTHYSVNGAWMRDMQLLEPQNTKRIEDIPARIVQGRWDVLCPSAIAYRVHKALPKSKLYMIPNAGHSAMVCIATADCARR